MAWCFSTRASVSTVLTTHPCISRCLRVNGNSSVIPWETIFIEILCKNGICKMTCILFTPQFVCYVERCTNNKQKWEVLGSSVILMCLGINLLICPRWKNQKSKYHLSENKWVTSTECYEIKLVLTHMVVSYHLWWPFMLIQFKCMHTENDDQIKNLHTEVNSLWPSYTIWQQRTESTLAQVMACCLTAPSHDLTNVDLSSVGST